MTPKPVFLLLSLFLTSCLGLTGGLKNDLSLTPYPPIERKIAINFTNESVTKVKNKDTPNEQPKAVEGFMLNASEYFLTTSSNEDNADVSFRFKTIAYESDLSLGKTILFTLYEGVSLLTLGILPYVRKFPQRLQIEVHKQNQVLKKYTYEDSYYQAISLIFLPYWAFTNPMEGYANTYQAKSSVNENLVKNFLFAFQKDFLAPQKKEKKLNSQK